MQVIKSNEIVFFDVDDTLVVWGDTNPEEKIPITVNHFDNEDDGPINLGFTEYLVPHKVHIEQLKKHKANGATIVVWSQGGWRWSQAVVNALGLAEFVDLAMSKPTWAYDDLPAHEFIGKTIWMPYWEIKNG